MYLRSHFKTFTSIAPTDGSLISEHFENLSETVSVARVILILLL